MRASVRVPSAAPRFRVAGQGLAGWHQVERYANNRVEGLTPLNQLEAVLVGADPQLRESLAGFHRVTLIRRCAQVPGSGHTGGGVAAAPVYTLRLLARRVQHLTSEIDDLTGRISDVLPSMPQTVAERSLGTRSSRSLRLRPALTARPGTTPRATRWWPCPTP